MTALAMSETSVTNTEGQKIGLPEKNAAQVSSKHNNYQVKFI